MAKQAANFDPLLSPAASLQPQTSPMIEELADDRPIHPSFTSFRQSSRFLFLSLLASLNAVVSLPSPPQPLTLTSALLSVMASLDDDDDFSILPSNDSSSSNPSRRHGPPPPPYVVVRDKSTVDDSEVAAIADSYNSFDNTANDPNAAASKDLTDTAAGVTSSYGNSRRSARYTPVSGSGGDYRKDREEWSDFAIACLLDTYMEKLKQLSRGNLRGRDWEEVAAVVSERSEKERKSVEQCKNKVDNLKKRFKLERHRMLIGNSEAKATILPLAR